jgi:hypothetical protein
VDDGPREVAALAAADPLKLVRTVRRTLESSRFAASVVVAGLCFITVPDDTNDRPRLRFESNGYVSDFISSMPVEDLGESASKTIQIF